MGGIQNLDMTGENELDFHIGKSLLMEYMRLYWDRTRMHLLVPEFKGSSEAAQKALFDHAASTLKYLLLNFPEKKMRSTFLNRYWSLLCLNLLSLEC